MKSEMFTSRSKILNAKVESIPLIVRLWAIIMGKRIHENSGTRAMIFDFHGQSDIKLQ